MKSIKISYSIVLSLLMGQIAYAQPVLKPKASMEVAPCYQLGGDIKGEVASDYSGYSVSLSSDGRRLAIGALNNSSNGTGAGHVRAYEWDTTSFSWTQLGGDIDGEEARDEFGRSVSISSDGGRLAIGAPYNSDNGTNAGHVQVYEWDTTSSNWVQLGGDIDGEEAEDHSGWSVSLSPDGERLAIGAPGNSSNGTDAGCVRVYEWSGTSWTRLGDDIDGEAEGDRSGTSVSISSDGEHLAIGAPGNDGNEADAGHVRVYEWSGTSWTRLGDDIDGEGAGDYSGYSVSLSSDGRRLAIGAPGNDDNKADAGHVRVYGWDTTSSNWAQLGDGIDGGAGWREFGRDEFGWSVSLSSDGERLAIGAPYNRGPFSGGNGAGHVRAYEWNGTGWVQLGGGIDGEARGDRSGTSVSLSLDGKRLAIGAPYNGNNIANAAGHVRVYEWSGIGWVKLGGDIDGEALWDEFGTSISLSSDGKRLAIGALYSKGNGYHTGHVRTYGWSGTSWVQLGGDIDGAAANNPLHRLPRRPDISVSLSSDGERLAIGAPGSSRNGNGAGHVRAYGWDTTSFSWTQLGGDIDGEEARDEFGRSVSISSDGERLAIGAPYNSDNGGTEAGHVCVYEWNGTSWVQLGGNIDGNAPWGPSGREEFGWSISLSSDGEHLAIGAPSNLSNELFSAGYVRVYRWSGTSWDQLGDNIKGEAAGDEFGRSVSISSDGERLAVGAPGNDGNKADAGHVRVYGWSGTDWVQLGGDIDGEAAGDEFGWSVSLSSDGRRLAIGAPNNSGNGNGAGHVQVYGWSGTDWTQLENDIDGEAEGDWSGISVSMSSDGRRLAIGASGNSWRAGHVRLYGDSCSLPPAGIEADDRINTGEPVDHDQLIRLYPNPAGEVINMEIASGRADVDMSMSIYDLFGRKVHEAYDLFIGGDRHEINMRDWAPGHYLVCLRINGEVVTRRFILSR